MRLQGPRHVGLALLLSLLGGPAEAQIPLLDKVFGNVSSIAGTVGFATLGDRSQFDGSRLRAFSIEMLLDVGSTWCRNGSAGARAANQCGLVAKHAGRQAWFAEVCAIRALDRTQEAVFVAKESDRLARFGTPSEGDCDSLAAAPGPSTGLTIQRTRGTTNRLTFEVGVGYSLYTGVASEFEISALPTASDPEPDGLTARMTGGFEEVPALAGYASLQTAPVLTVYGGIRAGLNRLVGFRATIADTLAVTGSGSGHFAGVAGGLALDLPGPMWLVGSAGHYWRRIAGVEWKRGSAEFSRGGLPATVTLSNWELVAGIQVNLK